MTCPPPVALLHRHAPGVEPLRRRHHILQIGIPAQGEDMGVLENHEGLGSLPSPHALSQHGLKRYAVPIAEPTEKTPLHRSSAIRFLHAANPLEPSLTRSHPTQRQRAPGATPEVPIYPLFAK